MAVNLRQYNKCNLSNQMLPRQRVIACLNHQEPDRVPVSLGGSAHKLTDSRYAHLKKHFGIGGESPQRLTGAYLSLVDNRVLDALGTDFRQVHLRPPTGYMQNMLPNGSWVDEWGLARRVIQGGYYELGGTPLATATAADLEHYPWPDAHDPARVAGLREEVEHLYHDTSYAITAYRPTLSGIFELSHYLRGMQRLLTDLLLQKAWVDALLWKLTEVLGGFYEVYLDIVGPYVQIVEIADDVGTQQGPMFSPKLYKELMLEKHAYLAKIVKAKAPQAKFMLHSCGSVRAFIPHFIEAGFDILNPVQPRARGMDPGALKAEFGSEISFLGGVDVQQTMCGPVEGVRAEVRQRIEELGPGGGFVLAPSHNFGDDVPVENILAFFDTAKQYGAYPLQVTPA
jgi:uroporphyrinogen decarboxylase